MSGLLSKACASAALGAVVLAVACGDTQRAGSGAVAGSGAGVGAAGSGSGAAAGSGVAAGSGAGSGSGAGAMGVGGDAGAESGSTEGGVTGSGGAGGTPGSAGAGGSCEQSCEVVEGHPFCSDTEVTWLCPSSFDYELFNSACRDPATALVRYCCPPSFHGECP